MNFAKEPSISPVLKFMQAQKYAVLSTVNNAGRPEAATIECVVTDNCEVIFDTFRHFRKFNNLIESPKVALVFGWNENVTVQYEGEALELSGDELAVSKKYYLESRPAARKFAENPDVAWFRVKPVWIRYTDVAQDPWIVKEFTH